MCPQCDQMNASVFETVGGLDRHILTKHSGHLKKKSADFDQAFAKLQRSTPEEVCKFCRRCFLSRKDLVNHLASQTCIKYQKSPSMEKPAMPDPKVIYFSSKASICKIIAKSSAIIFKTKDDLLGYVSRKKTPFVSILAVGQISQSMYKRERKGTEAYKFDIRSSPLLSLDGVIYKTICTSLDGKSEIKVLSNDISWQPPSLARNRWCMMAFFNLKYTKTAKGQYISINGKDGGWIIFGDDKEIMFASGKVFKSEISFDEGFTLADEHGAVYASKKEFEITTSFKCPWLSFAIDRVNKLPCIIDTLNAEQAKVVKLIRNEIDKANAPYEDVDRTKPNIHFINGLPGTGKTYLLTALYYYCRSKGINCKIVSFTKMVANMYKEGATIHSYFGIRFCKGYVEREDAEANPKGGNLYSIANLRVLFIDEICTVRETLINIIDECLRKVHNPKVAFGGILVIGAGDFNQLPPVNIDDDRKLSKKTKIERGFSTTEIFKKGVVNVYLLETPCRVWTFPDKRMVDLINSLMSKDEITLDSSIMLKSISDGVKFIYGSPEDWPSQFTNNNIFICLTHTSAFEVNTEILSQWLKEEKKELTQCLRLQAETKAKKKAKGTGKKVVIETKKRKLEESRTRKKMLNMVFIPKLKEGAPMFCIKNTKGGLVNGSHVIYKGNLENGKKFWVKELDSEKEGRNYELPPNEFNFDWGFTLTVHKAQGRTFDKVCVVFLGEDEVFVHGQLMVAFTRVRSIDNLRIIKPSNICKNVQVVHLSKVSESIKAKALNKYH